MSQFAPPTNPHGPPLGISIPQNLPPDESIAGPIIGVNLTFLVLASSFLAVRIYSRSIIRLRWGADDYFIFFAWILYVAFTTISSLQTRYGAGRHVYYVNPDLFPFFFASTYVCTLIYAMYQWAIKMSLALLYLRVFTVQTVTRNFIYGLIGFITVYAWTFFLLVAFQCLPVTAILNPAIPRTCTNTVHAFIASSVISASIDLTLIVIVIPRILQLRIHRVQKIALLVIVNLGFVSIVATILRTVNLTQILSEQDFLWYVLDFLAWTGLELSTAMICASAPVIRPALRKLPLVKGWMTTMDSDTIEEGPWTMQSRKIVPTDEGALDTVSQERLTRSSAGKLEVHVKMYPSEGWEASDVESAVVRPK